MEKIGKNILVTLDSPAVIAYNNECAENAVSSAYLLYKRYEKGNQVRVLSDPVTVFGESVFKIPLHNPIIHVRRGRQTLASVSQETCLVYEMSFRARLNIQQME